MALNQLGLGFVFTAKDLASGVIDRVGTSFTKMEGKSAAASKGVDANVRQFGQGLTVFGAGVAVVGTAFALADKAGQFEQALAEAGAAAGASAREMQALRGAALDTGVAMTGFSAEDAARTLSRLTREGLSVREALDELTPSLTLAAISGRTAEESAGFLSDAVGLFGLSSSDAGRVVDGLAVSMRSFGLLASELEPAMKGVATGVQLTGASFEDAMLAVGLGMKALPDVSRAAMAANQAMLQLADPKIGAELGRIGIAVKDQQGKLRPLVDIMGQVAERTAGMTEAQRASTLASIFSNRAAGGLSVIMKQLDQGVRDSTGALVRGAAAVAVLRTQMSQAGGAAAEMRDRLLDTFEGQKRVLVKSLSTLSTVVGEPFALVFKPVVRALASAFARIADVIRSIPMPVKKALASFTLAIGGALALFGAFVAAKAGVALLLVGLKALGISVGGMIASFLPAIAIFAALAVVVAGFALAFKRDIGGIRTFFESAWSRVRLLFQGLSQLFEEGGFSGAVMKELNRAENAGLKQFAIRVFQIVYRIKRFFEGLAEGFGAAVERAQPVFEAFSGALREIGEALGLVSTKAADAAAGIPSDRFAAAGASIGDVLAKIVTVVVDGLTIVVRVVTGIINGVREAFEFFKPVFDFVGEAIGFVADEFGALIEDVTGVNAQAREGGSVWRTIGEVIGWVAGMVGTVLAGAIGVVALALRTVITIVRYVIKGFVWLGETIGETAARIYLFFTETIPNAFRTVVRAVKAFFQPIVEFFTGIVDSIRNVLDKVIVFTGKLVAKIPSRFRPAFLDSVVDAGKAAEERIAERAARAAAPAAGAVLPGGMESLTPAGASMAGARLGSAAAEAAMPGVAEVQARGEISDAEIDAIVSRGVALSEGRPVQAHVTINVDGETLARASAKAERNAAARSFVPVPVPG